MDKKLVSVIIPTYNRANTIIRSINSILNQTYDCFEVIVVDDGSSDDTEDRVRMINDSRVRYIKLPKNNGVSYARNIGIKESRGEYIAFNDSDDSWKKLKLETQLKLFDVNPEYGMVFSQMLFHDTEQVYPVEEKFNHNCFFDTLLSTNKVGTPTMVIKKSVLDEVGGFEEQLCTKEDWELALRIAHRFKVGYVAEPLIDVFPSVDGVNKVSGEKRIAAELFVIQKYWSLVDDKSVFHSIELRINSELASIKERAHVMSMIKELPDGAKEMVTDLVLTVLIPVYNAEKHLRECLDSACSIAISRMEIICINDGSTDSSLEIIREYACKDSRFLVLDKKNTGYGDSLNQGIERARGKYILILESDDILVDGSVERLFSVAEKNSLEVIKGNYYLYYSKTNTKEYCENFRGHRYNEILEPNDTMFFTAPSLWAGLYRRDFLFSNNISFLPTKGAAYQDTSFAFKVWACAKRVMLVNIPIVMYRQDYENSSSNINSNIFAICGEFQEIRKFLFERGFEYFLPVYEKAKYISYKWNFQRINYSSKIKFIFRVHEEFLEECINGWLQKQYWADEEWIDIHKVIFDLQGYCHSIEMNHSVTQMWSATDLPRYRYLNGIEDICVCGDKLDTTKKIFEENEISILSYLTTLDDLEQITKDTLVLISASEELKIVIENYLEEKGFYNYLVI